jgi:hypothetical protein
MPQENHSTIIKTSGQSMNGCVWTLNPPNILLRCTLSSCPSANQTPEILICNLSTLPLPRRHTNHHWNTYYYSCIKSIYSCDTSFSTFNLTIHLCSLRYTNTFLFRLEKSIFHCFFFQLTQINNKLLILAWHKSSSSFFFIRMERI